MNYEYDLDPSLFTIVTENLKTLICNNCEKKIDYYLYNKTKKTYCSCLNLITKSKGSKVKLVNARLWGDSTEPSTSTENENLENKINQ